LFYGKFYFELLNYFLWISYYDIRIFFIFYSSDSDRFYFKFLKHFLWININIFYELIRKILKNYLKKKDNSIDCWVEEPITSILLKMLQVYHYSYYLVHHGLHERHVLQRGERDTSLVVHHAPNLTREVSMELFAA